MERRGTWKKWKERVHIICVLGEGNEEIDKEMDMDMVNLDKEKDMEDMERERENTYIN